MFEAFEDPKHCKMYIVMELCTGGDLCGRLRQPTNRHGVGEKGVATMMEEMLSAVLYCHTHGVVHRDIKVRALRSLVIVRLHFVPLCPCHRACCVPAACLL